MRVFLVALSTALLLAGCGVLAPEPEDPTADAAERGGTLRAAISLFGPDAPPDLVESLLDPQRFFWHPFGRCCLTRTLLSYNGRPVAEGGAELQPDLAVELPEVSADGLTWTFRLREGLMYAPPFADREIVARDFITALERTAHVGDAPYFTEVVGWEAYRDGEAGTIAGMRAPDDHTVEIELVEPVGDLGNRVALPFLAPIPAEALEAHAADYGRFVVSSGPYMIDGLDDVDVRNPDAASPVDGAKTDGLTLVRNPSWSAAEDPLRPAHVDRIELTLFSGLPAALDALEAGEIDIVLDALTAEARDALLAAPGDAVRVHDAVALTSFFIPLNLALPPFDDVAVRRAVALAVDRDALVAAIDPSRSSAFAPANHAFPDAVVGGLLRDYAPFTATGHAGDVVRAQAAMRESRYDTDGDGRCDGRVCEVRANRIGLRPAGVQALAADLEEIGITLVFDEDTWMGDPFSQVGLAALFGWASDYPNATDFALLLRDPSPDPGINFSLVGATADQLARWGYEVSSVPGLDDRLEACAVRSGSAAFACWAELDQHVTERLVAWIPVARSLLAIAVGPRIDAFAMDETGFTPALANVSLAEVSE